MVARWKVALRRRYEAEIRDVLSKRPPGPSVSDRQ
jgi:hypothetical protein